MRELFTGGGYARVPSHGTEVPAFVYEVTDVDAASAVVANMYVDLELRRLADGKLAMHLEVPDRATRPWAISIAPDDIARMESAEEAARQCRAVIRGPDHRVIDLDAFIRERDHDWSGRFADALTAFNAGDVDTAGRILEQLTLSHPQRLACAHHLLGRCERARDHLGAAVEHYGAAARLAVSSTSGHFLPYAAGVLSDLAVAYRRMEQLPRAAFCLRHSLSLRPNHPAALATYFTLFGAWHAGWVYGAARIRALGGAEALVSRLVETGSKVLDVDPRALEEEIGALVPSIDLASWPWVVPALTFDEFTESLRGATEAQRPPSVRPR